MFLLQALVLNLEKEIVLAEDVAVGRGGISRRVVVLFHQALGDFAFQAARESDQSFGVFREKLLADARLVVETAQRGFRRDLRQVAVAFFVFREHQKMVVGIAVGRGALDVVVVLLADVKLAADDRLHAGLVGRIHEMDRAEDIAVVGHGDRGHAQLFHALDELFHVAGAVEHGVVGMEMQVNELGHEWSVDFTWRYSNGKLRVRNGRVIHRASTAGEGASATLDARSTRSIWGLGNLRRDPRWLWWWRRCPARTVEVWWLAAR